MERISYFVSWKCNDLFGNTPIDVYYEGGKLNKAENRFEAIEKELKKVLITNGDIEDNDYIKITSISMI